MAQEGYTPIKIYSSSRPAAVPVSAKLINDVSGSEIAINIKDGILYYKDADGVVQQIARKAILDGIYPGDFSFGGKVTASSLNVGTGPFGTQPDEIYIRSTAPSRSGVSVENVNIGGSAELRLTGGGNKIYLQSFGVNYPRIFAESSTNRFSLILNGIEQMRIRSNPDFVVFGAGSLESNGAIQASLTANRPGFQVITNTLASYSSAAYEAHLQTVESNSWYFFSGTSRNLGGVTSQKITIYGTGDIKNQNNSYGGFSDQKLKENIVDSGAKLSDLMKVRIRNYNMIGSGTKQLGVIAQELEPIFPGLVDETTDRDPEGNDLETTTKSVKYSVFVPILIKAMQEQHEIIASQGKEIDRLTEMLTALDGRIAALENKPS
jgi:hypothetical protein